MRGWRPKAGVLATLLVVGVFAAPPVSAEQIRFTTQASGANHVPSNPSAATGSLDAVLDTATKAFSWTIAYAGLSGPPLAAHFHGPAPAGRNAGIVVPITGNLSSPISGSATLTDAQIADLMAGNWYVNLHTAAFPSGEIRGQVVRAP